MKPDAPVTKALMRGVWHGTLLKFSPHAVENH